MNIITSTKQEVIPSTRSYQNKKIFLNEIFLNLFSQSRSQELSARKGQEISFSIQNLNFDEALNLVQSELKLNERINSYVIKALLNCKSTKENWEYKKKLFYLANENDLKHLFNSAMIQARLNKDFDFCQKVFFITKELHADDVVIYSLFMEHACDAKDFKAIHKEFVEAKKQKKVDPGIYTHYITAASKLGHYKDAKNAFLDARDRGLADGWVFCSIIKAADRAGDFQFAQNAFDSAKAQKKLDAAIYTAFIKAAGAKRFKLAAQVYQEAVAIQDMTDSLFFTAFIGVARDAGEFQWAEKAFLEALNRNQADVATCNSFMSACGKARQYSIAKNVYAQAKPIANEVTYATFITVADECNQFPDAFQDASKAFEEAKKLGKVNLSTYKCFIIAAGNAKNFEAVQKAFDEIKDLAKHSEDVEVFNCYITACGKCKQYQAALSAFNLTKELEIADTVTHSAFITAADRAREFQAVSDAFAEAKALNKCDLTTYNSVIKAAGRARKYIYAQTVFYEIRKKADGVTYCNFIIAATLCHQFTAAVNAFIHAKKWKKADVFVFTAFMTACGYAGEFELCEDAFKESSKIANTATFNCFITEAGLLGRFKEAFSAFKEAKRRELMNVKTFTSMMIAAGHAKEFQIAKDVFEEGKIFSDGWIYSAFITAASYCNEFGAAQRAFEEAKKLNLIHKTEIYNSYIIAAGKARAIQEAQAAFNEARENGLANKATYYASLDLLMSIGKKELAEQCFEYEQFHKKIKYNGNEVDLHNIPHGVAILAVEHVLKTTPKLELSFITGIGVPIKDNYLTLRDKIQNHLKENFKEWECTIPEENIGQLNLKKIV